MALAVRGMADLTRTFSHAPADVKREYRKELRTFANPVKVTAESLAVSEIRRMFDSPQWAKMRVGITQKLVYVAPRQRGVKSRGRGTLKRPNLGNLLADRVLEPSLEQNRGRIEHDFEVMTDRLVARWGHNGP